MTSCGERGSSCHLTFEKAECNGYYDDEVEYRCAVPACGVLVEVRVYSAGCGTAHTIDSRFDTICQRCHKERTFICHKCTVCRVCSVTWPRVLLCFQLGLPKEIARIIARLVVAEM